MEWNRIFTLQFPPISSPSLSQKVSYMNKIICKLMLYRPISVAIENGSNENLLILSTLKTTTCLAGDFS